MCTHIVKQKISLITPYSDSPGVHSFPDIQQNTNLRLTQLMISFLFLKGSADVPASFRRCFKSGCGVILFPIKQWGDSITSCGKRRVCVNKPAVVLRVSVWFANINSLKPKGVCFWNYLTLASHIDRIKNTWNPARGFPKKHCLSWNSQQIWALR